MSFITTKFHEILLSGFRGVALKRKTGLTDLLTDWLTDGSKTLYPPQLVAWGIKRNRSYSFKNKVLTYLYVKKNKSELDFRWLYSSGTRNGMKVVVPSADTHSDWPYHCPMNIQWPYKLKYFFVPKIDKNYITKNPKGRPNSLRLKRSIEVSPE